MGWGTIALLILVGLAAGFLSGLIGIGGGVIIVPALVFFSGFYPKTSAGNIPGYSFTSGRDTGCNAIL